MSCYSPLYGYKDRPDHLNILTSQESFAKKIAYDKFHYDLKSEELISIPCGKCIGCRLDYSRQWAFRCMNELQYSHDSWFITLTYNNDSLHYNYAMNEASGVKISIPTLYPRDLQLFLKRLRAFQLKKNGVDNVRFFACGEYGDQYARPHYHIIVFNCPLDDLTFYKFDKGHSYYNSKIIEKLWHQEGNEELSNGFAVLTDVTWDTCAYTARYIMKKQKGKDSFTYYSDRHIVPEFIRMSRRPGIGYQFFDDNKHKMYINDVMQYYKGQVIKPVRYYDRLYDVIDPETILDVKNCRRLRSLRKNDLIATQSDYSINELNKINQRNKLEQISCLTRDFNI